MKRLFRILNAVIFCFILTVPLCASNGITFNVETLSKPTALLPRTPLKAVFPSLARFDSNDSDQSTVTVFANSKSADSIVVFGQHAFFECLSRAYANHHPITLSPDMIWLLISQGFAQHVTNNAEELRTLFVSFTGKMDLIVRNDSINLDNPNSPWEHVFPTFASQLEKEVSKELVQTLTGDFSTTTPTSRVASQITLMKSMSPYFKYTIYAHMCGIPEITLEGSPQDWQRVYEKAQTLRKYKLDWWMDALEPVLKQFVRASNNDIDTVFWKSFFMKPKASTNAICDVKASYVDGWITAFYPYDNLGNKMNLRFIKNTSELPYEMLSTDIRYIQSNEQGRIVRNIPLTLSAGFIGALQDAGSFGLKPEIGWMVSTVIANETKPSVIQKAIDGNADEITLRVRKFPRELLTMTSLQELTISFIDGIDIPDELKTIPLNSITITGKIDEAGINRILMLLYKAKRITINGKQYRSLY